MAQILLTPPRKATVLGQHLQGGQVVRGVLELHPQDGGFAGMIPQPRPFLGGVQTGFHYMPRGPQSGGIADQVLVLYESGQRGWCTVSGTDTPSLMFPLQPGESAIYGPDGSILCHAVASGPVTLYSNASGTVVLTIDPSTGKLSLTHPTGGGFSDNGTTLTVP